MIFVCEKCNERHEEDKLIKTSFPDLELNEELLNIIKTFNPEEYEKRSKEESRYYHKKLYWSNIGLMSKCLCGPLHEETPQEYFIFVTLEKK